MKIREIAGRILREVTGKVHMNIRRDAYRAVPPDFKKLSFHFLLRRVALFRFSGSIHEQFF
ncbi:hypothetical protein DW241_12340 [Hungatella hathewayi]|nr:hypothetical protein DW241_12340 [Hungatella hathewayi]